MTDSPKKSDNKGPTIDDYVTGIRSGKRSVLARAVTLIESQNPGHQEKARALLQAILPYTGQSLRIGVTGYPGAGKSTLIEALGLYALEQGYKPAVLAIDPSSSRNGGSILGDKTRMGELAKSSDCFIRPSPSAGTLGGIARKSRETALLCEAAGYNLIVVETVGVGQSETRVREMVDFYLLVLIAGAGDELQGIKRGIMEMADALVLNKNDGQNKRAVEQSQRSLRQSLQVVPAYTAGWQVPVLKTSALHHEGIAELWDCIQAHTEHLKGRGLFQTQRQNQRLNWFEESLQEWILERFYRREDVQAQLPQLREAVSSGACEVGEALKRMASLLDSSTGHSHESA